MDLVFEGEKRVTLDISGMSGGYEQTCQRMLYLGLQRLDSWPVTVWDSFKQYANIYGVAIAEANEIKDLETEWSTDSEINGDMTGAQHQAVLNHLAYIHKHNYQEWLEAGGKDRQYLISDPPEVRPA